MADRYDVKKSLEELWALHELYRRLGFEAGDIYFVPDALAKNSGRETVGLAVSKPPKLFVVSLDSCGDPQGVRDAWDAFSASVNDMPQKELQRMWESADVRDNILVIANGLAAKGLPPPKAPALWPIGEPS